MRVYENNAAQFKKDIRTKRLVNFLCAEYEASSGKTVTGELRYAWKYALTILYDYLQSTTSIGAMHRMGVGECHTCFTGFVYKPVPEIRNFR